ncbi:MAG TPA: glycosyltransferase family 2 protein [Desulfobacteria bacterium]|nr:glycosyltransferase family 2 protein [Desulfobacteria bacterium]
MLSVIIPTFNEKKNVRHISRKISDTLKDCDFEIFFVDDSTDVTPNILEEISAVNSNIRFIHREEARGLATAVALGFKKASGNILCVMDADLQHPPELLRTMLEKINSGADLVVPSRFIPGGDDGGLCGIRKLISRTARLLAWFFLKRTRTASDPMSGFFMMKKHVIDGVELNPVGWKILLEILVKGRFDQIAEIPYQFRPRAGDNSKMSLKEQLNYLHHLVRLVLTSSEDCRLWKFAAVGMSGVIINLAVYSTLLIVLKMPVVLSGMLAAVAAMFSNFLLNSKYTWPDRDRQQFLRNLFLFYLFCGLGVGINGMVLAGLTHWFHLNYYIAQLIGIAAATLWNFTTNNRWNWGTEWETAEAPPTETEEPILSETEESLL